MPEKRKPGRTSRTRFRPVVNAQNSAHDILVNIDSENQRDLLGDAGTPPTGVAAFHRNDGIDEFFVGSLRTRPMLAFGRKQDAVLSLAQQAVEMQQRGRLQNNSGTENTSRTDEKRAQPAEDPVCGAQVGRALAPSIEDQQLMPENQGLGDDGTESARPCQSRDGRDQMNQ